MFAYSTLYVNTTKISLNIQWVTEDDESTVIWPVGKETYITNNAVIPLDGRFYCTKRIIYNYQCGHDLVADKKLVIDNYDFKWLNNHNYLEMYPNLSSTNIPWMPNQCF